MIEARKELEKHRLFFWLLPYRYIAGNVQQVAHLQC
jgi:hypothetical protein